MGVYQVETDEGVFEVEIDDGEQQEIVIPAWEGAKDAVSGTWDFLGNAATGIANFAIDPIGQAGEAYDKVLNYDAQDYENIARAGGRMATGAAGAMVGAPGGLLGISSGYAAGGALFDKVVNAALGESTDPQEDADRLAYDFGGGLAGELAFNGAPRAASKIIRTSEQFLDPVTKQAVIANESLDRGVGLGSREGQLLGNEYGTFNRKPENIGTSPTQMEIGQLKNIQEQALLDDSLGIQLSAQKTKSAIEVADSEYLQGKAPDIYESEFFNKGAGDFDYSNSPGGVLKYTGEEGAGKMRGGVENKIAADKEALMTKRTEVISDIDETLLKINKSNKDGMGYIRGISFEDISGDLQPLRQLMAERRLLIQSEDIANEIGKNLAEVQESFERIVNGTNVYNPTFGAISNSYEMGELMPSQALGMMKDINVVNRYLKAFDKSVMAGQIQGNPSVNAGNGAMIETLSTVHDALDNALARKSTEVINRAKADPRVDFTFDRVRQYNPQIVQQINKTYSALSTLEPEVNQFNFATRKALENRDPLSLAADPKGNDTGRVSIGTNAVPRIIPPASAFEPVFRKGREIIDKAPLLARNKSQILARDTVVPQNLADIEYLRSNPMTFYEDSYSRLLPGRNMQAAPNGFGAVAGGEAAKIQDSLNMFSNDAERGTPVMPSIFSPDAEPIIPEPKQGMNLPRNLGSLDVNLIGQILPSFAPPEQVEPLFMGLRRIIATGDKVKLAQYIGALSEQFPDMPIQRGAVTGLPSEFDLGDGKVRLFSPIDIAKWEAEIEKSSLRSDEKAQRIMALYQDGSAVPMSVRTALPVEPIQAKDSAYQKYVSTHAFTPREQTEQGSRRME